MQYAITHCTCCGDVSLGIFLHGQTPSAMKLLYSVMASWSLIVYFAAILSAVRLAAMCCCVPWLVLDKWMLGFIDRCENSLHYVTSLNRMFMQLLCETFGCLVSSVEWLRMGVG